MSLDGLLTFFGILLGIYAIADPVQRCSIMLFSPLWMLITALLIGFILVLLPGAAESWWNPLCKPSLFLIHILSFAVPVSAAIMCGLYWKQARITNKNKENFSDLFKTSLLEKRYNEAVRITKKNQSYLTILPMDSLELLFSAELVGELISKRSYLHLELLSDIQFIDSIREKRFDFLNIVIRGLLKAETSPLKSAVLSLYGGYEWHSYSDFERKLFESTFQNPDWYHKTQSHYPLIISSIEKLRSGAIDIEYNQNGRNYETDQGISSRSNCSIYLAIKTHVVAVKEAIKKRVDLDFYITDLWDVFREILRRSSYQSFTWESELSNSDHPTPFAYLLYEINHDLKDLSREALEIATNKNDQKWIVNLPGSLAKQISKTWSFCVWDIARSKGNVSDLFRDRVINSCFEFILKLGFQPSEIYLLPIPANVEGLNAWRDLYLDQIRRRFRGGDLQEKLILKNAIDLLDIGKKYVQEGKDWLIKELSLDN